MTHQRFEFLSQLVDPTVGLCLRPAKGVRCRWMWREELANCASSEQREKWDVDSDEDYGPRYTCAEAFRNIFLAREFRAPTAVRYNCFPKHGRGNNGGNVVTSAAGRIYVEYYVAEREPTHVRDEWMPWRALWLVFDGRPGRWWLIELMSEYWGPQSGLIMDRGVGPSYGVAGNWPR